MIFETYGNPEIMSIPANAAADEVLNNILDNVDYINDQKHKSIASNIIQDNPQICCKKKKLKTNRTAKFCEFFSFKKEFDDIPNSRYVDSINTTDTPIEKQIEILVNDIQQMNYDLENKCGIKYGFSSFLDKQTVFTKEILDAYISIIDLNKENINKFFCNQPIQKKCAYYDLAKSIHQPKNIPNDANTDIEDYEDEMVLNVTNLNCDVIAANVPLPRQTEKELKDLNENKNFLQTIAEIHVSMVGDQNESDELEKDYATTSRFEEAGECKIMRPVPNPEPFKHLDSIEEVKDEKCKSGLKYKLRSFFTKTPNKTSSFTT